MGRIAREGVDCQPEPEHLFGATQPGSQFVQLEVRDLEVAEIVLVHGLSVHASTGQPSSDDGMMVAEDTLGGEGIQPTSRAQSAPLRPGTGGGFQTMQGVWRRALNVVWQA